MTRSSPKSRHLKNKIKTGKGAHWVMVAFKATAEPAEKVQEKIQASLYDGAPPPRLETSSEMPPERKNSRLRLRANPRPSKLRCRLLRTEPTICVKGFAEPPE